MSYQIVPYAGGTPGANGNTTELFNSVTWGASGRLRFADFARYLLSIKNGATGTLKAYFSTDKGQNWTQFYEATVAAATTQKNHNVAIPVEPYIDVKVEWVNGGVAQAPWFVAQVLDDGQVAARAIFADANGGADPGASTTTVTTVQLPSSLGQKNSAGSLSVVQASDSAERAAASIRAPIRNEILVIPVGQTSVTFNIPDGSIANQPDWRGKFVEMYAENADIYLQFSAATNAVVNETQDSTQTVVGGRQSVAPQGNEGYVIPRGTSRPIPVLQTFLTFALKSPSAVAKLRTQLAQT